MDQEPVKICSKCGAEYSVEAQVCADCGGKLVFPQTYEKRFEPLAEDEEQVLIRGGPLVYIKELVEHMRSKGIRADIRPLDEDPDTCSTGTCPSLPRFGLFVTKVDEPAAKETDRAYWLRGAPEQVESFTYAEQELRGVCPACSTRIPEGSTECPECGLVVGSVEDVVTCPVCNAEVSDEDKKCPNCGTEFE
jgi:ribosomal protein L40E